MSAWGHTLSVGRCVGLCWVFCWPRVWMAGACLRVYRNLVLGCEEVLCASSCKGKLTRQDMCCP